MRALSKPRDAFCGYHRAMIGKTQEETSANEPATDAAVLLCPQSYCVRLQVFRSEINGKCSSQSLFALLSTECHYTVSTARGNNDCSTNQTCCPAAG